MEVKTFKYAPKFIYYNLWSVNINTSIDTLPGMTAGEFKRAPVGTNGRICVRVTRVDDYCRSLFYLMESGVADRATPIKDLQPMVMWRRDGKMTRAPKAIQRLFHQGAGLTTLDDLILRDFSEKPHVGYYNSEYKDMLSRLNRK